MKIEKILNTKPLWESLFVEDVPRGLFSKEIDDYIDRYHTIIDKDKRFIIYGLARIERTNGKKEEIRSIYFDGKPAVLALTQIGQRILAFDTAIVDFITYQCAIIYIMQIAFQQTKRVVSELPDTWFDPLGQYGFVLGGVVEEKPINKIVPEGSLKRRY